MLSEGMVLPMMSLGPRGLAGHCTKTLNRQAAWYYTASAKSSSMQAAALAAALADVLSAMVDEIPTCEPLTFP
ncbi:MAG: hypothetical protein ACR2Q4_02605 [Geminicoccaceae bacterium]